MKRIDTSNWKPFKVKDIFSVERGKRHKAQDRIDGDFPFYSASSENNGIIQYIQNPTSKYSDKIVVTIFCDAFYAEGNFSASDDTTLLGNDNLNALNAKFICVAISANKHKYDFKNKAFSTSISEDTIKLPVRQNDQGKLEPDWDYMESYMKEVEKQAISKINSLSLNFQTQKRRVDHAEWREFTVGDIFELKGIKQAKSQTLIPTVEDGIPYVVQSKHNNMISRLVDKSYLIKNNEPVVEGNCLVLGVTLNVVSYQPEEFGASQVITARNPNLNPKNGHFISTILDKATQKFTYKEKPGLKKYQQTTVKLPARLVNGIFEPDWQYMEDYMREIEQKTNARIKKLQNSIENFTQKSYN